MRILAVTLATIPFAAQAQSFQTFLINIPLFLDSVILPFLYAIAGLVFVFNVIRYFVASTDSKDMKENARNVAIYSVAAFVFLLLFNGIVNLLAESTGLEGNQLDCSDYEKLQNGGVCNDYVAP